MGDQKKSKESDATPVQIYSLDDKAVKQPTPSPRFAAGSLRTPSPSSLPSSPVLREVDLPPWFRATSPPSPRSDRPSPLTPSAEQSFMEETLQEMDYGYVSPPCPSPPSDLSDYAGQQSAEYECRDHIDHDDMTSNEQIKSDKLSPVAKRRLF
uniref:Uncharacterized protein n=1 Tax=Oryza punctata TaxID=4537 RepID=A0A0E0M2A7_ORYPU